MSSRRDGESLPRLSRRQVDSPSFSDTLNGQVNAVENSVLSQFFEQGGFRQGGLPSHRHA